MSDVDAMMDLEPRYEFLRELGRGGMGRVLLLKDGRLGREVALKLFHEDLPGGATIERAQKEFDLLTRIEHPGIARAIDARSHGGMMA